MNPLPVSLPGETLSELEMRWKAKNSRANEFQAISANFKGVSEQGINLQNIECIAICTRDLPLESIRILVQRGLRLVIEFSPKSNSPPNPEFDIVRVEFHVD